MRHPTPLIYSNYRENGHKIIPTQCHYCKGKLPPSPCVSNHRTYCCPKCQAWGNLKLAIGELLLVYKHNPSNDGIEQEVFAKKGE